MFAPYLQDTLAGFADALILETPYCDGPTIAGEQLTDPAILGDLLDRYAMEEGYENRRAVASQWSKFFFSRLIIPTLAVQLGSGQALGVAPRRWRACFSADGLPKAFVFDTSPPMLGGPADFSSLIDDALIPVVTALHADCRMSARVFWSNAAVYFIWALGQLESQAWIAPARLSAVRALLDRPQRKDGGLNPFYRAYKALPAGALDGNDDPATHCRRLCCLRDLDPKWGLCANCPRAVQLT